MRLLPPDGPRLLPPEGGPLVVTLIAKGGAGKSTSTLGLGEALLAVTGWRVRLVDLDPQASLTEWAAPEATSSICEVLDGPGLDLRDVVVELLPGLDLVPAHDGLADIQRTLAAETFAERVVLASGEDGVDVLLIDTRASGPLAPDARLLRAALDSADLVLCPFEVDATQARALRQVLADIAAYAKHEEREVPALLMPTRVRRIAFAEEVVELMTATSPHGFLGPIRESPTVKTATRRHQLLGKAGPRSTVVADYAAAALALAVRLRAVNA